MRRGQWNGTWHIIPPSRNWLNTAYSSPPAREGRNRREGVPGRARRVHCWLYAKLARLGRLVKEDRKWASALHLENLHPSPRMKTLRSGSVSENLPAKFSSTVESTPKLSRMLSARWRVAHPAQSVAVLRRTSRSPTVRSLGDGLQKSA